VWSNWQQREWDAGRNYKTDKTDKTNKTNKTNKTDNP